MPFSFVMSMEIVHACMCMRVCVCACVHEREREKERERERDCMHAYACRRSLSACLFVASIGLHLYRKIKCACAMMHGWLVAENKLNTASRLP